MDGVIIVDPATAYIGPEVRIGAGSVIKPNTTIEGSTEIGENCVIGPNSILTDARVYDDVSILMSVVNGAVIGKGTTVGPFAYLRPGSVIGENVRIGDFVEVKNSIIGDGTKISHLTYVGDANVGKNVNFGCGSVTVNYDGLRKSRCAVEDGAFIGCNTNLIAPVAVGRNSYTAAGSTITQDVPENSLAVSRVKQRNVEGWVLKRTKPELDEN
jgi:bifunctional UDP-N-acetylglucosamine pyrophosphorylase/glucosamine-1-phosphate N-acetyltransferase